LVRTLVERLKKFYACVRYFREDASLSSSPVLFAQIGTNKTPDLYLHWNCVKEQQRMINLPCPSMITADDLPLKNEVHFTRENDQIIGQHYAEAFLELKGQAPHCR
jgi:hypothetical protein